MVQLKSYYGAKIKVKRLITQKETILKASTAKLLRGKNAFYSKKGKF